MLLASSLSVRKLESFEVRLNETLLDLAAHGARCLRSDGMLGIVVLDERIRIVDGRNWRRFGNGWLELDGCDIEHRRCRR